MKDIQNQGFPLSTWKNNGGLMMAVLRVWLRQKSLSRSPWLFLIPKTVNLLKHCVSPFTQTFSHFHLWWRPLAPELSFWTYFQKNYSWKALLPKEFLPGIHSKWVSLRNNLCFQVESVVKSLWVCNGFSQGTTPSSGFRGIRTSCGLGHWKMPSGESW